MRIFIIIIFLCFSAFAQDLNNDGVVNMADFAVMSSSYTSLTPSVKHFFTQWRTDVDYTGWQNAPVIDNVETINHPMFGDMTIYHSKDSNFYYYCFIDPKALLPNYDGSPITQEYLDTIANDWQIVSRQGTYATFWYLESKNALCSASYHGGGYFTLIPTVDYSTGDVFYDPAVSLNEAPDYTFCNKSAKEHNEYRTSVPFNPDNIFPLDLFDGGEMSVYVVFPLGKGSDYLGHYPSAGTLRAVYPDYIGGLGFVQYRYRWVYYKFFDFHNFYNFNSDYYEFCGLNLPDGISFSAPDVVPDYWVWDYSDSDSISEQTEGMIKSNLDTNMQLLTDQLGFFDGFDDLESIKDGAEFAGWWDDLVQHDISFQLPCGVDDIDVQFDMSNTVVGSTDISTIRDMTYNILSMFLLVSFFNKIFHDLADYKEEDIDSEYED